MDNAPRYPKNGTTNLKIKCHFISDYQHYLTLRAKIEVTLPAGYIKIIYIIYEIDLYDL